MSQIVRRSSSRIVRFDPAKTRTKLAHIEGQITEFRHLRDWPQLEEAVNTKISEQRNFTLAWEAQVRPAGRQPKISVGKFLTVAEAETTWGIDAVTVSRWRMALRDPDNYRAQIMRGAYRAAALVPADHHRTNGTGENEWFTPGEYVDAARAVLDGIDLDPASHPSAQISIRASRFFTEAEDGLSQPWHGRIWLNPPYARGLIDAFVDKLLAEISAGHTIAAITLTHNYTDTGWFQLLAGAMRAACFVRGRVRFVDINGTISNPTQGQVFCYFGPHLDRFIDGFRRFGCILRPIDA